MKLIDGFVGRTYCVDEITLHKLEVAKLNRLKLCEGSYVRIVAKHRGYPFLVELEGNRLAFSKEVAQHIKVIPYG